MISVPYLTCSCQTLYTHPNFQHTFLSRVSASNSTHMPVPLAESIYLCSAAKHPSPSLHSANRDHGVGKARIRM